MHFLSCAGKKKKREGTDRIGSRGTTDIRLAVGIPGKSNCGQSNRSGNVSNAGPKYHTPNIPIFLLLLRSVFAIPPIVFRALRNVSRCHALSSFSFSSVKSSAIFFENECDGSERTIIRCSLILFYKINVLDIECHTSICVSYFYSCYLSCHLAQDAK